MASLKQVGKKEVDPSLLGMAEELLEAVKKGGVIGVAIATVNSDATTANCFLARRPISLIGELEVLKRDVIDCHVDLRKHDAGGEY